MTNTTDSFSYNLSNYTNRLNKILSSIEQSQIDKLYIQIKKRINSNNSIYIFGNGGSQANAHHIVGDYTKTLALAGLKLKISCLADNICYLTAASNDLSYQEAYSILLGTIIETNDLLIYLSGSGNSINLVKCARKASLIGITQVSVTSFNGGALKEIVDIPIYIKGNDMEIAEDIQLIIFHYLKQRLTNEFSDKFQNDLMNKYDKRTKEDLVS